VIDALCCSRLSGNTSWRPNGVEPAPGRFGRYFLGKVELMTALRLARGMRSRLLGPELGSQFVPYLLHGKHGTSQPEVWKHRVCSKGNSRTGGYSCDSAAWSLTRYRLGRNCHVMLCDETGQFASPRGPFSVCNRGVDEIPRWPTSYHVGRPGKLVARSLSCGTSRKRAELHRVDAFLPSALHAEMRAIR
jgi:hypothetical protein